MNARPETRNALGSSTAGPAGPPPPPPPPRPAAAPAPAARVLSPTPQDDYYVKATSAAPVIEPVASPAPAKESGAKSLLTIVALVVGVLGGMWAVRALRSDEPALNLGADGQVTILDAKSAFAPLNNYQYRSLPEAMKSQIDGVVMSLPEAEEKLLGFDMRAVARDGQVVGVAVVAAVTPGVIQDRAERQSAFDGLEEVDASEPEKIQLGGLDVYTSEVPTGNPLFPNAHGIFYFYENLVVMVIGFDESTAQDFTAKFIEAGP